MYNNDDSIAYLADDATQQPIQQERPPERMKMPQVNHADGLHKMHNKEDLQWQDYTYRAGVAPYMSHYDKPRDLHQKYEDVLGSTGEKGSSFKTGLLLSSLLLLGSVAGYSLEKKIQKKSPKGYGAILGSLGAVGIYYVGAKTLSSGIMEGAKGLGGFTIPMIPIFVSMYQGKKLDNTTAMISAGIGLVGSSYVRVTNFMK